MATHGTNFYFVWLLIGVVLVLWGIAWKMQWIKKLPLWIRKFTVCLVAFGGVIFLIIEGLIISKCFEQGKGGLDYVIVLGAYLRKDGPSTMLEYRLDKAFEYYLNNPNVKIVGQGFTARAVAPPTPTMPRARSRACTSTAVTSSAREWNAPSWWPLRDSWESDRGKRTHT